MEIDVRDKASSQIDRIRFDDPVDECQAMFADSVYRYSGDCSVWISKTTDHTTILGVRSKESAEQLIKALQKAVELNWFED